jgi:hypothetical protein
MTRLNKLYADLELFNFYLDYLHNSLANYYSKRMTHWTSQYRRRQIEDIRESIPLVYEDIESIKKEIQNEKNYLNTISSYNEYDDNYDYNDY